jgi:RimJ/RimL family protein N-acetyltransferase
MTLNIEHITQNENIQLDLQTIEKAKLVPLTVRLVSSVNEFSELEDVWDRLAIESSSTIYQTFAWSFYWWKSYSTKRQHELYIILFYDDTQLVGIAPLFINKRSLEYLSHGALVF